MNWLYISLISLLLIITIQPSYVHPDEQFQSLQILSFIFGSKKYANFSEFKCIIPWEFEERHAARSYVPLYLVFAPIYYIIDIIGISDSFQTFQLVRLYNLFLFLLTCKLVIILKRKSLSAANADLFWKLILTSFITSSLQSHTFSNSIETNILLLNIEVLYELVAATERKMSIFSISGMSFCNGILISLGIFNRITYPAFIFLPLLYMLFKFYIRNFQNFKQLIYTIISFTIASYIFVVIDTKLYRGDSYVVTPLNNLLYNLNPENLSKHGLHPRYTHILINLPQIIGPVLFLLYKLSHKITLYSLSIISSLVILSIFQHQEMRFLIPLYPIICLYIITDNKITSITRLRLFAYAWIVYNITLTLILGVFHQSGVLLSINHMNNLNGIEIGTNVWWKTYSPPTWFYTDPSVTYSTVTIIDNIELNNDINFHSKKHNIIDLKGCDLELLRDTLQKLLMVQEGEIVPIQVIAPNSVKHNLRLLSNNYSIKPVFHTWFHLDMDHFDINQPTSFQPGIAIYNVTLL